MVHLSSSELIIILLFGIGRISKIARELGSAIKDFRETVKSNDDKKE